MVPAQGNAPLPDLVAVGHYQVRGVGSQRKDDRRFGRIFRIVFIGLGQVAQLIEEQIIVQGQGRKLHDVDFDAQFLERLQGPEHGFPLHGEKPDFGFQGITFLFGADAQSLVVPDHVV